MCRVNVFVGSFIALISGAFAVSLHAQPPHADHSVIDWDYLPEELDELDPGEHAWHCWIKVRNDEATLSIKAELKVWVQQKQGAVWSDISGPHTDVEESISPNNSAWLIVGGVDNMPEGEYRYRWVVNCAEIVGEGIFGGPGTTIGPELSGWTVEED